MDEAKAGSKQRKWGYVSDSVGDELTLRISKGSRPPRVLGLGGTGGNSSVLAGLGLLKSYRGMGAAAVSCAKGCSCTPQVFELQHKQEVSLLQATIPSSACKPLTHLLQR